MAASTTVAAEIRKLRKKLRQIENLERIDRPLDELEEAKVFKKFRIRDQLQALLNQEVEYGAGEPQHEATRESDFIADATQSSPSDDTQDSCEYSGEVESDGETAGDVSSSDVQGEEDGDGTQKASGHVNLDKKDPVKQTEKSPKPKETNQQKVSPKSKDSQTESLKRLRAKWRMSSVKVGELEGHCELITSVYIQGSKLVSGSRDTTVKLWDLKEERELCSLGGHTESVNCVMILSPIETSIMSKVFGIDADDSIIISGSSDCSFKLWSAKTGTVLHSVYTFSPVTYLDYSYSAHLLVTASDGGKLDLWNPAASENQNIFSTRAHEDSVNALKVMANTVYSASEDGFVMVHEIRDRTLVRFFVSEDIKLLEGTGTITRRPICCLEAVQQSVIFGDQAVNLKVLDWKKGTVRKLTNHTKEFASTDALCFYDNLLLSSSYDLDKGTGYINVRLFPSFDYVASLSDEYTERIECLACTQLNSGNLLVVSGGMQLSLWEIVFPGNRALEDDNKVDVSPKYIARLAHPATQSEDESEDDGDDTEDDDDGASDGDDDEGGKSWLGWCSVL